MAVELVLCGNEPVVVDSVVRCRDLILTAAGRLSAVHLLVHGAKRGAKSSQRVVRRFVTLDDDAFGRDVSQVE